MKRCPQCGEDKPLDAFGRDRTRPDGRFSWCSECKRAYRRAHREQIAAYWQTYWARPEVKARARERQRTPHRREYEHRWNRAHREQLSARTRDYARRNPERIRAISDRTRQKHAERRKEAKRAYYASRGRDTSAAWRARNRARRVAIQAKRQAALKNAPGHFTPEEWSDLKARYGNVCLCCRRSEGDIRLVPDHVIPLSKGGSNAIENIQPLCVSCNCSKRIRTTDYRLTWNENSA